jgi:hypothetical protein
MKRRAFIALLGGAAAGWPFAASAQQAGKLPTIGFLGQSTRSATSEWVAAFVQRLRELGWIDARTVVVEYRWAEGRDERLAEIAAEFVRRKVDVIVTSSTAGVVDRLRLLLLRTWQGNIELDGDFLEVTEVGEIGSLLERARLGAGGQKRVCALRVRHPDSRGDMLQGVANLIERSSMSERELDVARHHRYPSLLLALNLKSNIGDVAAVKGKPTGVYGSNSPFGKLPPHGCKPLRRVDDISGSRRDDDPGVGRAERHQYREARGPGFRFDVPAFGQVETKSQARVFVSGITHG